MCHANWQIPIHPAGSAQGWGNTCMAAPCFFLPSSFSGLAAEVSSIHQRRFLLWEGGHTRSLLLGKKNLPHIYAVLLPKKPRENVAEESGCRSCPHWVDIPLSCSHNNFNSFSMEQTWLISMNCCIYILDHSEKTLVFNTIFKITYIFISQEIATRITAGKGGTVCRQSWHSSKNEARWAGVLHTDKRVNIFSTTLQELSSFFPHSFQSSDLWQTACCSSSYFVWRNLKRLSQLTPWNKWIRGIWALESQSIK